MDSLNPLFKEGVDSVEKITTRNGIAQMVMFQK